MGKLEDTMGDAPKTITEFKEKLMAALAVAEEDDSADISIQTVQASLMAVQLTERLAKRGKW